MQKEWTPSHTAAAPYIGSVTKGSQFEAATNANLVRLPLVCVEMQAESFYLPCRLEASAHRSQRSFSCSRSFYTSCHALMHDIVQIRSAHWPAPPNRCRRSCSLRYPLPRHSHCHCDRLVARPIRVDIWVRLNCMRDNSMPSVWHQHSRKQKKKREKSTIAVSKRIYS